METDGRSFVVGESASSSDLRSRVLELLETRDLRFYGNKGWDNRDSLKLALASYDEPVERIDTLATIYRMGLENMSEAEVAWFERNLRRCPPRPATR
jgi:hypothetical protein